MNTSEKPIGIFDSGIGGLSVLLEARKQLPHENFIFYGDNQNAPYGTKNEEQIKKLSLESGAFLFQKGAKAIVMACNTATSAAVWAMRDRFQIPVISMEPAVKPALKHAKDGRVLVLATQATLSQQRYLNLLERLGGGEKVINVGCPGLVELLETGRFRSAYIDEYLRNMLSTLKGAKIDGIVIGCTHYSFIGENIKKIAGEFFTGTKKMFDGKEGTVRQLKRVLAQHEMLNKSRKEGKTAFYSSGGAAFVQLFEQLTK